MTVLDLPPDPAGELGEVPDPFLEVSAEPLAETLDRYVAFHKRFVHHPDDSTHDLAVLWAAHTHAMPTWRATPRVFIVAPEPGCGKTTQAEVIKFGARNGIRAGSASAAGLFAIITDFTVFLDETDNLFSDHPDRRVLQAIINDGYVKDGYVLRKTGPVPVYGALAFAGIENGRMPEPTRQRCIPIQMRVGEPAEAFDPLDYIGYHFELQTQLVVAARSWKYVRPDVVNRTNQVWAPLHSVAAAAGGDWPERARHAQEVHQWPTEANEQKAVLSAIRDYFAIHNVDRATSTMLATFINADDTLPAVTPKALAGRMKGYGVAPAKSNGSMTYWRKDLEPVWAEWL